MPTIPMNEMMIPPSSHIETITEVQPVNGFVKKIACDIR